MWGKSKRVMVAMLAGTTVGVSGFGIHSTLSGNSNVAFAATSSTFNSDFKAAQESVKLSSSIVQSSYSSWDFQSLKSQPKLAYDKVVLSFSGIAAEQAYCLLNLDYQNVNDDVTIKTDTSEFAQDWTGLTSYYNHFKPRFSKTEQSKLATLYETVLNDQSDARYKNAYNFGMELSRAIASLDSNGRLPGAKSSITKLTAKKTASKKNVKVTGTAKLYKSANYAHIKTYKGYHYAKLSSKHTFSKIIYAPKAKTVKATVGHYSNGRYTAVTSVKVVNVSD